MNVRRAIPAVLACASAAPLALTGCSTAAAPSPTVPATQGTASTPEITASKCAGAKNWSQASSLVGSDAFITGPVRSVLYETSSTGDPTFLNIGADYPRADRFTVVIWGKNRSQFVPPPESAYRGETVCVRGRVQEYRGVPQMQISSPSQIVIDS